MHYPKVNRTKVNYTDHSKQLAKLKNKLKSTIFKCHLVNHCWHFRKSYFFLIKLICDCKVTHLLDMKPFKTGFVSSQTQAYKLCHFCCLILCNLQAFSKAQYHQQYLANVEKHHTSYLNQVSVHLVSSFWH